MVFAEESTVAPFPLRARREGLRDFGACLHPQAAWQLLQGIETLPLRMDRHVANTRKVIELLLSSPTVESVAYSELPTHRDHALAERLLPRRAGAVFSFDLKGGVPAARKFIESLALFSHLANVGDARSLVIHPASTMHFRMDAAALAAAGIGPGRIRLSIGLEDPDDLIDDLKRGLKTARKAVETAQDAGAARVPARREPGHLNLLSDHVQRDRSSVVDACSIGGAFEGGTLRAIQRQARRHDQHAEGKPDRQFGQRVPARRR